MRALALIAVGGVVGSLGLALWAANTETSTFLSIVGIAIALAGGAVGLVGLIQNHRDHTTRR